MKSEGKYDLAKKTIRKIRNQIRKDRLDNTIKDLEDQLWHDIKKAKSAFVPSHTKLLNKEGIPCTSNERPDILADYFEHTQWAIDHEREKETPSTKLHPNLPPPIISGKFTIEELHIVIRKLKNNKSLGPDGIPTEFLKYLDGEGLEIVLDILNDCWEKEILPSELELAELVTL